ncbi:MAG: PD-(D/E)XK nuclease family protein [Victivallaceae bacterium]|nr:PD-(D/E)XK nuclease family protein [Victivallaceae bacterium]
MPAERTFSCLPFGRLIHAALSEKARSGASFTAEAARRWFGEYLEAEICTTENLVWKDGESLESLTALGEKMLDAALDCWDYEYEVKSVAEAFSVEVPGLSRPVIGEFDLVTENESEPCIVDWKTAASKWPMGKVDYDLQATVFSYAYRKIHGTVPVFRFDVITKAKTPTVNSYFTVRTQDELDRFEHLARQLDKAISDGHFYPNADIQRCSGCPYREACLKSM